MATRRPATTPRVLGLTMVVLVVASLALGAVCAWTIGVHASAAQDVVHSSEPLSFEARQMYQALSDADVTATTGFLSGPDQPLAMTQRYDADIAQAGADLSDLKESAGQSAGTQLSASLAAVTAGLPVYTGYVAQARAFAAGGYSLTGGSFMQVASEQMHVTLLPAARSIYAQANASLAARSAEATGLPWIAVALVLAAAMWIALFRVQRWLSRRTRRTFNLGLLGASVALTVAMIWLIASFAVARSDLAGTESTGSTPAQALAQATITVQRARGDQVLNLISRSGSTSFQSDFEAARHEVGPGAGSLLDTAAAQSGSPQATRAISAADADARAWYATSGRVFSLNVASNYAAETALVIGSGPGQSAAGFTRLEGDLTTAIAADQQVFTGQATSAAGAYSGLEIGFIIAALLMAAGCAWGLSQRLAEYQ